MTYCTCPSPTAGAGTLTDYTVMQLYRLCRDCGLPIRLSAIPAPRGYVELWWLQRRREWMKRTVTQ